MMLLLLPIAGPLGVLVGSEIVAKRMTMQVPVCFAHQHHWFKRTVFNFAFSVPIACLFIGAIVPHVWRPYFPGLTARELEERLWVIIVILIVTWVVITAALDAAMTLPDKIDKSGITLRNVHPSFEQALALSRSKEIG
jgi:hypothetical protein